MRWCEAKAAVEGGEVEAKAKGEGNKAPGWVQVSEAAVGLAGTRAVAEVRGRLLLVRIG